MDYSSKLRAFTLLQSFSFSLFFFIILVFCHVFVFYLFICLFSFLFRAVTGLFLFNLILEKLILHIFLIIMTIIRCSGMFHVPGFIESPEICLRKKVFVQNNTRDCIIG